METSARLYTLNYNEAKTYMWAAIFVACNLVLPVMAFKLAVLALIAGFTAQHFRKVTLPLLIGVVLVAELAGGLGELALTGGIEATVEDFTIGWPGLLLQIIGAYLVCKYL